MKNLLIALFILLAYFSTSTYCLGQPRLEYKSYYKSIDSLTALIRGGKQDSNKVNNLNELSVAYSNKLWFYDTAVYYSDSALRLAKQLNFKKGIGTSYRQLGRAHNYLSNHSEVLKNFQNAKKIYEELGEKKNLMDCYFNIGSFYSDQGNFPEALKNTLIALQLSEELKDTLQISGACKNIAAIYESQDNYPEALSYTLKALKLEEKVGNKKGMAAQYNNLGTLYSYQANYPEALKNYNASLKIRETLEDKKGMATCHNNIGLIYQEQNNYAEALKSFFLAVHLGEGKNFRVQASALNNIGTIYILQNNYPEALKFISKSLLMHEKTGYKYGIANCLIVLSEVNLKMNNLKEANKNLNKALLYSKEIGSKNNIESSYYSLVKIDSIQGNWKSAFEHHKLFIQYRDSLNNEESDKKITEILLTNKFQQQEEKLQAENEKQQAIARERTNRQTIISWSIGGGLFLVLVFAGFVLRSLRITNKQKSIIETQKDEVTKQKDIAEELRKVAEKQKYIVEEKQKEIVDSITYAKRIQTALLTSDEYITNNFEAEHFILFKPKDIVSGDFYWALTHPFVPGWDLGKTSTKLQPAERRKNLFYIATADCTGHGVPGAFMSMLNISFLNENIIERGILLPHEILNSQRKQIISALNQEGSKNESKDGMDCILCVYDFNKMLMHFAAANNPLWLVRNNELTEFTADKMPVGKYSEGNASFTLQTIELQKGDVIYTSTDGYADQFGVNNKKLMKKRFKEELLKIHPQPMPEQKQYLDQFFETWKGNNEQVDDVCVIGVRI